MATNFPTSLDSFDDKVDNVDDVEAAHINNLQDAVAALEAKTGITDSAVATSHDYRIGALEDAGYITGVSALNDVGDVTITSNTSGELLKWSGSAWVNNTLAEAGISAVGHAHATSDITSGTFADARISESSVTQHQAALSITESQISDLGTYLTDITGENIADLSDVAVTTPADNEVLAYDNGSGNWINQTAAEAGLAAVSHTHTESDITDLGAYITASSTDTLTNKSGAISQWTNDAGYITATLTQEQVEDYVGAMVTGNTETNITVTYQDADGTLDFEVADAFLLNTGDVGTGSYDFGGADDFELPNSATPTVDTDGQIALDTTVTDWSHGILKYYGGEEMAVVAMPVAQLTSPTDGYVVSYNGTNNEFELVEAAGGSPGGSDTQIQYNDGGALSGMASTSYNDATGELTYTATATTSTPTSILGITSQSANLFAVSPVGGTTGFRIKSTGIPFTTGIASGLNAVFGDGASASGQQGAAYGDNAVVGGQGVSIGRSSQAGAGVSVGWSASGTGTGAIAIGLNAESSTYTYSQVYGRDATATANNQLVFGHVGYEVTQAYFGGGVTSTSPIAFTMNATGASGTDVAAGDFYIAGGKSTGNAAPGDVIFQTATAGASGTTLQSLANHLTLGAADGSVQFDKLPTLTAKVVDAGTASATESAWIEVEIDSGGSPVTGYVRLYATK